MRAEGIVLDDTAPMGVYHLFSLGFLADTVLPMIFVRKAAARPTQNGYSHLFQGVYNIAAHTVYIRNIRVFADIHSVIDTSAEVLAEMTVNILADFADFLIWVDKVLFHKVTPFIINFYLYLFLVPY